MLLVSKILIHHSSEKLCSSIQNFMQAGEKNFMQAKKTLCKNPKLHSSVRNFMQASKTSFKCPKLYASIQNFIQVRNFMQACKTSFKCPKLHASTKPHSGSYSNLVQAQLLNAVLLRKLPFLKYSQCGTKPIGIAFWPPCCT